MEADPELALAIDRKRVVRRGHWTEAGGNEAGRGNRYCWPLHLQTDDPGAQLEFPFEGVGVAIVFHQPRTPAYRQRSQLAPLVRVEIDDRPPVDVRPDEQPLEVLVADDLPAGSHRLVLTVADGGCALVGFRVFGNSKGHFVADVQGDNSNYLFDVRLTARREGKLVRTGLHRNWLSGRVAMTGLPPAEGYRIGIDATGWQSWEQDGITIRSRQTIDLGRILLRQNPATIRGGVQWPALGYQAVRMPGETVEVQVAAQKWRQARLSRRLGPGVVSRVATMRGRVLTIPADMPPGVYDLQLFDADGEPVVSPRSVVVKSRHAAGKLTIMGWGHTDTWGQFQAEFEQALVSDANIIGPDVVLISNSVNAAYISGALADLESPYLINFGNHRLPGHENWYGSQVGAVDLGPDFVAFNFGHDWGGDAAELESLVASRRHVPRRLLNAFEGDAPIEFLGGYGIRLLHYAHGTAKPKDAVIAGTHTQRVGKHTASSFRLIRMDEHGTTQVVDPLHVRRSEGDQSTRVPRPPLRVERNPPGELSGVQSATLVNEFDVPMPAARVVFLLPQGEYRVSCGEVESAVVSDDGKWIELSTRVDIDAKSLREIAVYRAE